MALASAKLSCRLIEVSDPRRRHCGRTPGGSPATFHAVQAKPGEHAKAGEQPQSQLIAAGALLDCAHARREGEATDAASHTDHPGHHADLATKTLRHQLENRAVTGPQTEHGADEKC